MAFRIITSETNRIGEKLVTQLYDGNPASSAKWLSLDSNVLDGSFFPIDTTGKSQVGYWSVSESDVNGLISNQIITIEETRLINNLQVIGYKEAGEYPVDFTVDLYKDDIKVFTKKVIDNKDIEYRVALDKVYEVDKVTYTFTKINKAHRSLKLLDLYSPGIDPIEIHLANDSVVEVQGTMSSKLVPTLSEGVSVTNNLSTAGKVSIDIHESKTHTVVVTKPDEHANISLKESSGVKNVHTIMDAPLRQVFGKVEITYAAPFLGSDATIESTEVGRHTDVGGIADDVVDPEYKWMSLHDNRLDGSYHPMPRSNDRNYHAGLWGTQLSREDGSFETPPVITLKFVARPTYYLKVAGDSKLKNYPVDFDIHMYNEDVPVYAREIRNNTETTWYESQNPVIPQVTKITLTIHKISKAGQVFKIAEFFNSIIETYYSKEIVNMHMLEELDYIESSVTLGAVSSNEIDIVLDNSSGKFNVQDPSQPLRNFIKRNRKVRAWLGCEVVDDEIEWYPLGTFYTSNWNIPDRSLTASLTARDRIDLLSYSDFNYSEVYKNKSIGFLFELILTDAGLADAEFHIDESLYDVTIPYAWFPMMSHRDALQRIAGCIMVQLYCDREGRIVITNMDPTNTVFFTYKDSTNVITKSYPFMWNEITNYVEVTSKPLTIGDTEELLRMEVPITLKAGESQQAQYTYTKLPILEVDEPIFDKDRGIIVEQFDTYCWGCIIKFKNNGSTPQTIRSIVITGKALESKNNSVVMSQDKDDMAENGTMKTNITHDFIQELNYAQKLADDLLQGYHDSRYDVSLECRGNIGVYLRHKVLVEDSRLNSIVPYVVKRQTIDWNGALSATTECKRLN